MPPRIEPSPAKTSWDRFASGASLWLLLLLCTGLLACQSQEEGSASDASTSVEPASVPEQPPSDEHPSGEKLARIHCQRCHAFTDPEALNKQTWNQVILPRMGHRLGIYKDGERPDSLFEEGIGGRLVREAGIFPEDPMLPREDWNKIVEYFLEEAPKELPSPSTLPEVTTELEGFQVRRPSFRFDLPRTTLVHIEEGDFVLVGNMGKEQTMALLDAELNEVFTMALPGSPSSIHTVGANRFVTLMGQVAPSDRPAGRLIRLDLKPQTKQYRYVTILDSLQRPVHSAHADLTGNGRQDILVSEFGHRTGRLSWFKSVGRNQYEKQVLREAPGALRSVVRDFTGNGRLDVMALMGQGDEGVYLFHNQGDGEFREEGLLRFPPTYGSTHFELADFNDDGHLDLLHTAGDNADYEPVMRPYHGLRIFINDGEYGFDESYFYPLNGAYHADAHDFDGDGDLDIAAISFFPDYDNSRPESFVYLENTGGLEFEASSPPERDVGRWLVMDSGDLGSDGDEDLLLGSFSALQLGTSYVPEVLSTRWTRQGPSVLGLENVRPTE